MSNNISSMELKNHPTRLKADKVFNYKSYSKRKKIDNLLFINADQYCNLGIESSKNERSIAESNSRYIYKLIQSLDYNTGRLLLRYREE